MTVTASRRRLACIAQAPKSGSTLIWVLVVSLVLTLILGVGLGVASMSHSQAAQSHTNNQAYYTAFSTTTTFEAWIKSQTSATTTAEEKSKIADFLDQIPTSGAEKLIGMDIALGTDALPENTGTCLVNFKFTDTDGSNSQLKITSTATYQDSVETVSVMLEKQSSGSGSDSGYPVSDFNPDKKYGDTVAAINNGTDGYATDSNPVNIAFNAPEGSKVSSGLRGSDNAADKRDYNPDNRNTINSIITETMSNREVTWMETSNIGGDNRTSGPRDDPYIAEGLRGKTTGTGPIAKMMLLTPINGKLAINPISAGGSNFSFSSAADTAENIKVNEFSISDTEDKSLKLRLGNYGTGKRSSNIPKYAYIGLDFYDNNTPMQLVDVPNIINEAVSITNPSDVTFGVSTSMVNGIPFYPNKWQDATIYLKNSESINSQLIFGSYGRIHSSSTMDYRQWANYVNYHWGYVNQNMDYIITPIGITEFFTNKDAKDKSGFAYPPVYWGNNFSMYLLDGASTSEAARIMQGVYLVNQANVDGSATGVLYSNRDTLIGGALTTRSLDRTYEGTLAWLDGFDGNANWTSLPVYQPTYHQVIQNTDIVLKSDGATVKNSEILHPDGIKNYVDRTLTIAGGTIYVGNKHTLTIDSEIKDGLEVKGEIGADGTSLTGTARDSTYAKYYNYTSNGNRMYIKPNYIEVAAGGTLTILGNANDHDNVETDIYVNGGTLNISEGAKIKGNIYVYNDGIVNVNGSFRLDSAARYDAVASDDVITAANKALARAQSGIRVYGQDAAKNPLLPDIQSPGKVNYPNASIKMTGTANKIHFMGDSKSLTTQNSSQNGSYLCDKHEKNGQCLHFGEPVAGEWTSGIYADR